MTAINSNSASVTSPAPGMEPVRGKGTTPILPPLLDESFGQTSWKAVYTIVERGLSKRHFVRIGVAFVNRDGSLNVKLDAVPVNGQLHIRDAPPRDGRDSGDPFVADRDRERSRNREVNAPF